MANQSAAYDLSLFERKKATITPLHGKKVTKADKRRQKIQRLLNGAAVALVGALVLTIITLMIVSQIKLTEMNSLISKQQVLLTEQLSETKRLESERAAQTSAQSVEEYAEEHGMQTIESGQIDYITVDVPQEKVEKQEKGFWDSVLAALQSWVY